jgi:release factor glutamine methyltransferase
MRNEPTTAKAKMTLGKCLELGAGTLAANGVVSARLDARILLAAIVGLDQAQLISAARDPIEVAAIDRFSTMIEQRLAGMPVHRILGGREFYGSWFSLNEETLEPRPETELLVDRVLADMAGSVSAHFADVGVGSGAIAISLLLNLSGAKATGTDISKKALEAAQINADRLGVADCLRLVETDCLAACDVQFDFIVSNPPYIMSAEIEDLAVEVRDHDPRVALDGGADGFAFYRKLLEQARSCLNVGGKLYLETGHGQHGELGRLAKDLGWSVVSTHFDLNGLERVVVLAKHAK